MSQRSLKVLLPLLWLVTVLCIGSASLVYTVHERQNELTETARASVLGDVARLTRLASRGWDAAHTLIALDVAQIASQEPTEAVLILSDTGLVLKAQKAVWVGKPIADVWPTLVPDRLTRVASGRLPDWRISADGMHMDALQAFDLPSSQHEVRASKRALVYVSYDLSYGRAKAVYAEVMSRMPDLIGLLVFLGLMAWLLERYVAGPLGRLNQAVSAIRAGKSDVVVPRVGFQEVAQLGGGVDALQQELAATWRAMPDLMFEISSSGRYLRVLSSRPELLVTSPDVLIGKTLREVLPESAADVVHQAIADAETGGAVWGRELMLDVPAGRLWFDISVAKKFAPDTCEVTFMVISRDITERKRSEDRLRQLNDELEQRVADRTAALLDAKNEAERANQSKSEFLSRMSHELRTPLNAILGFGQLLELAESDPVRQGHVKQILGGGKHLLALINEVLDLARVESGRMSVSLDRVCVSDLVQECLDLIHPQAVSRDVRVVCESCPPAVDVLADHTRLKQVLLNLLSNAIKYNRRGGLLTVACEQLPQAFKIKVTDTGAGLSADEQSRLFVPFERLNADEYQIEGSGIGLALSKRLVQLMQGQIGVDSTKGQGSTFWIQFALAPTEASSQPDGLIGCDQARPVAEPQAPEENVRTVLCMEDNPNNLQLMESILGMLPGVRTLSAIAPGLGLEIARSHRPDLILLDINMPDMDGFETMRCLREHPATSTIPVVAVSANAMEQDLARGMAAGFADYVTKPIDVGRLLRVVEELTAHKP